MNSMKMPNRRDLFSLIPAHAGVIHIASARFLLPLTYPRACGGDPLHHRRQVGRDGLIPAHAGVIPGTRPQSIRCDAYPRACGGDPYTPLYRDRKQILSPRMRG